MLLEPGQVDAAFAYIAPMVDRQWTRIFAIWILIACLGSWAQYRYRNFAFSTHYKVLLALFLIFIVTWPIASPHFCENVRCRGKPDPVNAR